MKSTPLKLRLFFIALLLIPLLWYFSFLYFLEDVLIETVFMFSEFFFHRLFVEIDISDVGYEVKTALFTTKKVYSDGSFNPKLVLEGMTSFKLRAYLGVTLGIPLYLIVFIVSDSRKFKCAFIHVVVIAIVTLTAIFAQFSHILFTVLANTNNLYSYSPEGFIFTVPQINETMVFMCKIFSDLLGVLATIILPIGLNLLLSLKTSNKDIMRI